MPAHVLVPVDDSERSDAALEFALSTYPEATITTLHVIDPAEPRGAVALEAGAPEMYDELRTRQEEVADGILEEAADRADDHGVSIETERMVGSVEHSIVEFADDRDVDHVVIGSHGRTGASRVLLGSVAETVARRASVPVTIVR